MRKQRKRGITAEEWNEKYPVGTRVRIESVRGDGAFEETATRSAAWDVCGAIVVLIEGRSGGCAVSHMEIVR